MNVLDAAHRIGHEYPGGAKALAVRMDIGQTVFNSKLNPNTTTHHLTLVEALRMQQLSGRYDILQAMADELGHVAVPLPAVDGEELTMAISRTCAEFGQYLKDIDEAWADKKITANEAKRLETDLTRWIAQATHLQSLLAAKVGER
jgi:hypothetical protein